MSSPQVLRRRAICPWLKVSVALRPWRPALEAAKIPDFRFHDCRHTFTSRLAMAGVDLYTIQRAGGWKTQVMVQRYAHLSPDHMRAAVERLAMLSECGTGTKT